MDGQGIKWHRNISENVNRLSRAHQRYRRLTTDKRQQTDGRLELANLISYVTLYFGRAIFCFRRIQRLVASF